MWPNMWLFSRSSNTEPARCGLRVFFMLLVLLAGCASPPPPKAPQIDPPLEDQSAASDYDLATVSTALRNADDLDAQGNRIAAAYLVESARAKLPQGATRENLYLDVILASIWGRQGEGRDAEKANDYLQRVQAAAIGDARLRGDAGLAQTAVHLGAPNLQAAQASAQLALSGFAQAKAWVVYAGACRQLTGGFLDGGDAATALKIARQGARVCDQLKLPLLQLKAWVDVADLEAATDPQAADAAFLRAYSAAYRHGKTGWLSIVVASAVGAFHARGHHALAAKWGDRCRDDQTGELPRLEESGLQAPDYATLLGQYGLSLAAARPGDSRKLALLEAAKAALEAVETPGPEIKALHKEVEGALLQSGSGK